jgi:hypothetical protein
MKYTKPVIEKWNAVVSIQDANEKPGQMESDIPFTPLVGTANAYQADE